MKSQQSQRQSLRLLLLSLLFGLCISTLVPITPAYADLPPRPLLPPAEDDDEPARPVVAPLILSTDQSRSDLWSVVQWQDAQGDWQDVTGWRGSVVKGRTSWWVEEKDFGKDSFRWVVMQGNGGPVVATSAPFTLPSQPKKALVVEVAVP